MKINKVIPKPFEDSIFPAIMFQVDISFEEPRESIIDIQGWLESDDEKILAKIGILPENVKKTSEIGASGSRMDSNRKEITPSTKLLALLDKKSLSYIESRRIKNKKRDVCLTLNLNIRSLVSKARISHFHEIDPTSTNIPVQVNVVSSSGRRVSGKILAYGHDSDYSSGYNNLWIISGDGGPVFLAIDEQNIKEKGVTISSSDWIYDFAPKMGLGEYFVVELPKGKQLIKEAWNYVEKAEENYRNWNTKGAYANCREVGKLLERVVKKKFKETPTIKKWKRAIDKFEPLTSMDLHEEDIKQEKPIGKITVGRPETEHILIVTKALIKYAEELVNDKT